MTDASYKRKGQALLVLGVAGLLALGGCGPKNYKQDADERVYTILDEKWDPEFGSKANYRISDTASSPNDIPAETTIPAGPAFPNLVTRLSPIVTHHSDQ